MPLLDQGNTVIVVEHNLDVIAQADWIIDMGLEGGKQGGTILFSGTLGEMLAQIDSLIAKHRFSINYNKQTS